MIVDTDRIQSDQEYRNELRHRCETDHYFLGEMVGWNKFIPSIHDRAKNLYFPKNRNIPIEQQHRKKNRIHLDPRKTFKTTLGSIDTLQWILAFPETITIVNESSTQPLAAALSQQTAKFLWKPGWKSPTVLQILYPELLDTRRAEPEGVWSTPNHLDIERDPTIAFTSPQTAQSGWHPWILNPDDMVDTTNSGLDASDVSRKKIINSYYTNKNTVRAGGYINIRGTRYHPLDLYGNILKNVDPEEWEVLIRASLIVKSGDRLLPGDFPAEDEIELLFPELLSYRELRSLFFEHYESFMCQQQNDPQGGSVPVFDEKLYTASLIDPERIPVLGDTYICWRLPYGGKDYMSTYVEGAAARIFNGRVDIIDAWKGIYPPSRLVEKIIRECRKLQTSHVIMEQVPGAEYIEAHLKNESYRKNHPIRIQWLDYEEDDSSRQTRMRQIEPMMRAGRLKVSTSTSNPQEIRDQFLNFSMVPENGIVDCVSRLASKIPVSVIREEIEEEEIELHRRRREQMSAHMAYGQAAEEIQAGIEEATRREQLKAEASLYAWENANSFGLPPLPGGLDG